MNSADLKTLKKLADVCRKAGIKSYKDSSFEFTLTDDKPVSSYRKRPKSNSLITTDDEFKSDTLSNEELLMWSAQGMPIEEGIS